MGDAAPRIVAGLGTRPCPGRSPRSGDGLGLAGDDGEVGVSDVSGLPAPLPIPVPIPVPAPVPAAMIVVLSTAWRYHRTVQRCSCSSTRTS